MHISNWWRSNTKHNIFFLLKWMLILKGHQSNMDRPQAHELPVVFPSFFPNKKQKKKKHWMLMHRSNFMVHYCCAT